MPGKYTSLPQLNGAAFLTDGGMETTLIFHEGFELPEFAAFVLLDTQAGVDVLRRYYTRYADIAANAGAGFIFETPTWRASADWGARLGYARADLDRINSAAIDLLFGLRDTYADRLPSMVISGCIGPRGDGYVADNAISADSAERYHGAQVRSFAGAGADMVGAVTMTSADEATGVARAAAMVDLPAAISFTVETDGRLPSGQALGEAIEQVDEQADASPAYFMVNCAHPTHFLSVLEGEHGWKRRIRGVRANASTCSHAELDEATTLDRGDPLELAQRYRELMQTLPLLNVFGGCCGTDHRHIEQISHVCA